MSRAPAVIRLAPVALGELVLHAVTGAAALALLAALTVCAPLAALGGPARRPATAVLAAMRLLAGRQHSWAGRVLGRQTAADRVLDHADPASPTDWTEPPVAGRGGATWREVAWLGGHAATGLGFPVLVWLLLSAANQLLWLHPHQTNQWITITLSLAIVAVLAITGAAVWLLRRVSARLAETLLRPSSTAGRIKQLTESRAAAVDARAAELRRIERDLHDGAQARLIAVRMSLGLARGAGDPAQVRALVEEAWESAGQALTDLRDLVRGIHPPVLADRGLGGAVEAAALLCPVPVEVEAGLPGRPDPPVESALYFAAAEALANVGKHSAAGRAWVRLGHADGTLRLVVGDDGRGGADPAGGTGLDGIRRRLAPFDGTLAVHSPPGGPTVLTMELPCALSSRKTSHS